MKTINVATFIVFISLSQFNLALEYADDENCLTEAIGLIGEVCNNKYFERTRKVIMFTFSDVLVRKLASDVKYERKLDENIRNSLNGVSTEFNLRTILNSLVTEAFNKINDKNVTSFHFINTLQEDDIRKVCEMIMDGSVPTSESYISPCLKRFNNLSRNLFKICRDFKLVDIVIHVNL